MESTTENESVNELKERDMEDSKKQSNKERKPTKQKVSTNIENTEHKCEKESADDMKAEKVEEGK